MKKIADKNSRYVTFSKRRSGLFKKAAEIATLCAAQIAIIVKTAVAAEAAIGEISVAEMRKLKQVLEKSRETASKKMSENESEASNMNLRREETGALILYILIWDFLIKILIWIKLRFNI